MSEKFHFFPGVAGTDDGGYYGREEGEHCDTEDTRNENLLLFHVKSVHWREGGREGGK